METSACIESEIDASQFEDGNHKVPDGYINAERTVNDKKVVTANDMVANGNKGKESIFAEQQVQQVQQVQRDKLEDTMEANRFRRRHKLLDHSIDVDYEGLLAINFIKEYGIVGDQIAAYNALLSQRVPQIVAHRLITMEEGENGTHVALTNPHYSLPSLPGGDNNILFPQQAREQRRTYAVTLKVDLELRRNKTGEIVNDPDCKSVITGVPIGNIPVMIGSDYDNIIVHGLNRRQLLEKGECPHDPRGYFIVRGVEKVVLIKGQLRASRILTYEICGDTITQITCLTTRGSTVVKIFDDKKCRSMRINLQIFRGKRENASIFQIFRILNVHNSDGGQNTDGIINYILQFAHQDWRKKIRSYLQGSKSEALSIVNDYEDIYLNSMYVTNSKNKTQPLQGLEQARYVFKNIVEALFPHIRIGTARSEEEFLNMIESKKKLLALMIVKHIEVIVGKRKMDNKNDWGCKRLESAGRLIGQLFRALWDRMLNKVEDNLNDRSRVKKRSIMAVKQNISLITDGFESAFISDQWSVTRTSKTAKNNKVTDIIDRGESVLSAIDQLLRINAPTGRQAEQVEARNVQQSQEGYIDPVATPSGRTCGLVKSMAIGCWISTKYNEIPAEKYLEEIISASRNPDRPDICLLNARPLGWCNGEEARKKMQSHRRKNEVSFDTALVHDKENHVFYVHNDGGRIVKPFIIVGDDGIPLILKESKIRQKSFSQLCEDGIIEWLDVWEAINHATVSYSINHIMNINEQRDILQFRQGAIKKAIDELKTAQNQLSDSEELLSESEVSAELEKELERVKRELSRLRRKNYTHVDIDPNLGLGVISSVGPYIENNQSPRNTFQCSMGRQAMGFNHSNYALHFPTTGKYLMFPTQAQIVTQIHKLFGLDDLPAGQNVILAICTDPDNEEDAITVKREFFERGGFNYLLVHSYNTIVKNPTKISNGEVTEKLIKPTKRFPRHTLENYDKLDSRGIITVGSVVRPGDCLVGKLRIIKTYTKGVTGVVKMNKEDASVYVDLWESGVVDRVAINYNPNREMVIDIRISTSGRPTVSDKMATRQAQKSTIGRMISEEEMPYTEDGITPDILLNPHALPKRMTIATYFEMVAAKYAAMAGTRINATSFKGFNISHYCELLEELYGFSGSGEETLYHFSGGKILKCRLMIGPTYYQLLQHQVLGKYQYRGEGPRRLLTRLPPQGRKRGGGVRLGEQERDALLAHGASNLLRDRTLVTCDIHRIVICRVCNNEVIANVAKGFIMCRVCNSNEFGVCEQAYTQSLLTRYCSVAGVKITPSFRLISGGKELENNNEINDNELSENSEDEIYENNHEKDEDFNQDISWDEESDDEVPYTGYDYDE